MLVVAASPSLALVLFLLLGLFLSTMSVSLPASLDLFAEPPTKTAFLFICSYIWLSLCRDLNSWFSLASAQARSPNYQLFNLINLPMEA